MNLLNIFKAGFKKYTNCVLASYDAEYTPRILSNRNSDSKYYVMKLGKVSNDE